MKQTCTTCNWRTTCEMRTSGNAQRCTLWKADHIAPGDTLMAVFGAAAFVFVLGILPLTIHLLKGGLP